MSWKGLAEMAPLLSEAEVRFEKKKRLIGLWLGPVVFFAALLAPPLHHVTPLGMRTLGVFLWTVVWWISEPIPIPATALFSLALLVFCGIMPVEAAFGSWANWINIFLLGACIIGHAMSVHGLTRRIAYRMVSSRLVGGSPWRLLALFGIGPALLASVLSHVVTTMIFLAIALGLVEALKFRRDDGYAEAIFLSIAWGANLGIITPVGTPPNLIAIGFAERMGYHIGFLEWIMACLPVFLVALATMFLVIRYVIRPTMPDLKASAAFFPEELQKLGPMSRAEKIAGGAFLTAMFLWMLPDLVNLLLELLQRGGGTHPFRAWLRPLSQWLSGHLNWSVSAILVATALFVIPVDWKARKFAMNWEEAVKGVEWGTLSLIAAALSLGNAVADRKLGLGEFFAQTISSLSASGASQLFFVLVTITFTVVVGSVVSNIAIVSMVGALVMAMAPAAGINPIALMVAVGVASSMDFALPIGTPPSAMVFASGYVRITTMAKGGAIIALLAIPIVALFGFRLNEWIFPWPR